MERSGVLKYRQSKPGQLKCALDLSMLYPGKDYLKRFHRKFTKFIKSDPSNKRVYALKQGRLIFLSEQLIPKKTDKRTPMLLVFGNPAPQSALEGMFFSFEGNGKEHRFWKHIMEGSGIINFGPYDNLSVKKRSMERKMKLLTLDYASHFRIGLCVFVSMPSGASGPWSGLAGIKRLLGAEAMKRILGEERTRVIKSAKRFLSDGGHIIIFQKEAWESLRSEGDPA